MKAERFVAQPALDNFFQAHESASTDKQDIRGVDREEFLVRMFASTLRRHVGDGSLEDFQQRLLHAFAGYVASDGRVLVLAADLVDLIDIDNALLRAFHIAVGGLQKLENDVLDVFTDIAGFGQGGRVNDGEGHAQHARQCLRQQSLAGAGGPNQRDIGFLNLDVGAAAGQFNALVMLVDGNSQTLLGFFLSDYIFIKEGFDFVWLGQGRPRRYRFRLLIIADDLVTNINAFITDVDRRPGYELLNFILRLTAE